MKRSLAVVLGAVPLLLLLAAGGVGWNRYFRTPSVDRLPIPEQLVSIQSPSGRKLVAQSGYAADYDSLAANFVAQMRGSFCGVASSVVVINAMRDEDDHIDQSTFFTEAVEEIASSWRVSVSGMSLNQLGRALRAHGADATVVYASDTDLEAFRRIARKNLRATGDFLLVNYQRAELGQTEGGHISPIAAYDHETDRFLILDVAAHKYPSVWVPATLLWDAMNAPLNPSSQRTRGFLIVREGPYARAGRATRSASLRSVAEAAPGRKPN
ncbi:phytochelatin synthase family protein [Luteimonas sp. SX5]|uniref:glutathione gamma-glutamylcysteinyltransferase n=1 Tax=Luteimonas galliterrae TaxID=2940486 RepID=A0ABT0MMJ7_9GAMM|nr:phytochelatin synthase family protein [Luteimonas galliterrae]MCL1636116.1 phytochelatin synthase family protein [Luteimonas galliterrae]